MTGARRLSQVPSWHFALAKEHVTPMVITVEEERAEELHGGYFFFRKLTFYWGGMSEAMVFTSSPCVPPHFPAALDMRLGSLDMRLGSLDWVLLDGNVGRDRPTFKNTLQRTSLVDRGLRFCTSSVGGLGSISGQETRSYMPQLRVCMPQQKIPYATTKAQCSQLNNFFIKIK